MPRVHLGFLDHKRTARIDVSGLSEVLNVIEGAGRQAVNPHAVLIGLDHTLQRGKQAQLVRVAADHFEYRLLDTMSVRLADFRHPS